MIYFLISFRLIYQPFTFSGSLTPDFQHSIILFIVSFILLLILTEKIINAQNLLSDVKLDYELRVKISEVCSILDVDGLRGDIVTNRASKAYAALNGRDEVTVEDIEKVITLCLRHRLRKDPLETIDSGDKVQQVFEEIFEIEK